MSQSATGQSQLVKSLDSTMLSAVNKAAEPYPIPQGQKYGYGTAGFRMKAANGLDHVIFTVGLIAAMRSKFRNAAIGIMITASHNPAEDNGVKLVDPMGDMLQQSWERYATVLANTPSEQLGEVFKGLVDDILIRADQQWQSHPAKIVIGRDTRASGPALVKALKAALDAVEVQYKDYGILTTPQLHHMVRSINTADTEYAFGTPTEEGYYEKMARSFKTVMHGRKISEPVIVDCANGVGGPKLQELIKYLPSAAEGGIDIQVVNADVDTPEVLNFQCGADYVKTSQKAPPKLQAKALQRCCSLDGDADRVVYYYADTDGATRLLDGDRIAILSAIFLADQARTAGIDSQLKIGVVQTAYANGSSTRYIEDTLKLPVVCTPTGVKHLHHAAEDFDIGVYFEANGHGTVLFSKKAIRTIRDTKPQSSEAEAALNNLSASIDLINQSVGDAISDMLFVETVLAHKSLSPKAWFELYHDLPNRLVRVEVGDRSLFKTTDAERKLVAPAGIQDDIDTLCKQYNGRSFARASGTENAVRVYAEAPGDNVNALASEVAKLVEKYGQVPDA